MYMSTYVLCTTDTTEGYVEAEKATRVFGLGLLDIWVYKGVGFWIWNYNIPFVVVVTFLLRLQIYKLGIWIIK